MVEEIMFEQGQSVGTAATANRDVTPFVSSPDLKSNETTSAGRERLLRKGISFTKGPWFKLLLAFGPPLPLLFLTILLTDSFVNRNQYERLAETERFKIQIGRVEAAHALMSKAVMELFVEYQGMRNAKHISLRTVSQAELYDAMILAGLSSKESSETLEMRDDFLEALVETQKYWDQVRAPGYKTPLTELVTPTFRADAMRRIGRLSDRVHLIRLRNISDWKEEIRSAGQSRGLLW